MLNRRAEKTYLRDSFSVHMQNEGTHGAEGALTSCPSVTAPVSSEGLQPSAASRHVSGWLKSPFYQVDQLSGITSERPDCLFMRKQDAQFILPVLLLFVGFGCVMVAANGFSSGICWHSVKSIYQHPLAHLHTCNPFCFVLPSNLLPDTHALKMINGKVTSFPSCTQMSLWKIFNGLSVAFHVTTCQVLRNSRVSP